MKSIVHIVQVLEIGGVEEPQKRYKVVVPENYHRFPAHFSLASLLLYSPRALRRITNFCRGKPAYIVPNVVGPEELRLSMALGIPLLAPEPRVAALFGSKSGAKRIFHAAQARCVRIAHVAQRTASGSGGSHGAGVGSEEGGAAHHSCLTLLHGFQVNVAPGAHDLYDEQDLLGVPACLNAPLFLCGAFEAACPSHPMLPCCHVAMLRCIVASREVTEVRTGTRVLLQVHWLS